jgi:F-type H+-transporting ATPase subunit gamma
VHLLVMTSDRGLCGGFNANVNRATERYIRENPRGHEQITLDIVGRKGNEYFKRRETPIGSYFRDIQKGVSLESASDIAEKAIVAFVEGELDALYVVYNEFKSAISQEVVIEQLLPVVPAAPAKTAASWRSSSTSPRKSR